MGGGGGGVALLFKNEQKYLGDDKLKSLSRREVAFLPKALTPALEIPRSRVKSREMPLMEASGIEEYDL